jgi:hypothetical protein
VTTAPLALWFVDAEQGTRVTLVYCPMLDVPEPGCGYHVGLLNGLSMLGVTPWSGLCHVFGMSQMVWAHVAS